MSNHKTKIPYLIVGVSILLGCLFISFFYLAVSNEPDYMPSQAAKEVSISKKTS